MQERQSRGGSGSSPSQLVNKEDVGKMHTAAEMPPITPTERKCDLY